METELDDIETELLSREKAACYVVPFFLKIRLSQRQKIIIFMSLSFINTRNNSAQE